MGEAKRRREQAATTTVERTDVVVNPSLCPHCDEPMRTLFTIERRDDAVAMQPGSVVICHHCVGVGWVDERVQLVKLDAALIRKMAIEDVMDIAMGVDLLRQKKTGRGETVGSSTFFDELVLAFPKSTGPD